MSRQNLTDRFINSRKPAPVGRREEYGDAIVPELALRVTDRGHKSFVLVTRYPSNPKNPTRRALGEVGAITLDQARQKARGWLELIEKGVDPKAQEARERTAAQRRQVNTFAAVSAEFLERHASGLSKSAEARRIIEGEFVKRWGARPIIDIMPEEIAAAIRAIVKRGAPYQARLVRKLQGCPHILWVCKDLECSQLEWLLELKAELLANGINTFYAGKSKSFLKRCICRSQWRRHLR